MIDLTPVLAFGLLLVRPGMVVVGAPVFGGHYAPAPIKVALTMILALALAPVVPVPPASGAAGIAVVALREAAIGLALGMTVRIVIAAAEFGGHLAGFQLGLSYAGLVDPQSGVRNELIAALYASLTLLTFFGVNGHHLVIRALVASFASAPIGAGRIDASLADSVARMLGMIFTVGAQLAAPVVIVLLMVELAMGLLARAAPALNLMVVGAPVRLLVGLFALSAGVHVVPRVLSGVVVPALELGARLAMGLR